MLSKDSRLAKSLLNWRRHFAAVRAKMTPEEPSEWVEKDKEVHNDYEETFDDLLKFGRYTVYLTIVFFMLIISQEMGFDFMAFGGRLW